MTTEWKYNHVIIERKTMKLVIEKNIHSCCASYM